MHVSEHKLSRARSEIGRLEEWSERELHDPRNKGALKARYNRATGCHEIHIAAVPTLADLTSEASVSAGVILHLLRSALDNLVFDLSLRNAGSDFRAESVQFPIVDSHDQWKKAAAARLAYLPHDQRAVIESFQPYHGLAGREDTWCGDYVHQLELLRSLSNADKHREIVEVTADPSRFELTREVAPILDAFHRWVRQHPMEYQKRFRPAEMRVGEVVFEPVPTPESIGDDLPAGSAIGFLTLRGRRPVVATLTRLQAYVALIVGNLR